MGITLSFFLLLVGFILLIKCADWFVEGAAGIAERFGISQLVIGLTVVAMGTSAPEAAVSINSALKGNAGISIGNVVGSNILNVLIILGITAVLTEVPVRVTTIRREIPFTILITVLLGAFGYFAGEINFWMGIVFWILFLLYLFYLLRMSKTDAYRSEEMENSNASEAVSPKKKTMPRLIFLTILGCAGIILGSDLAVDSATEIARYFGMTERFIGLTIIALGTSLPELATSVAAALKKKADIAIGNIVGSNIFNILFVIGTTALITPVTFEQSFVIDTAVAAAAMLLLLIAVLKTKSLRRGWGIVMLLCYAAYFVYLISA